MSDYPKLPDFNETNLWTFILKWRYAEMVHEIEEACIGVEGEISAMMHAYVDSDRAMRANDADDAARYRWLKANCMDTAVPGEGKFELPDFGCISFSWRRREWSDGVPYVALEVDAAIDAALRAEAQKKGGD